MPRPYSGDDLRWRMVYQRLFYQRRYNEIASQLFVCPKTVYRTITFLNSGDVKPYRLGRPTGRGLTTSRAFFVGDVNIFGMRLLIQIRYFFVNNRKTILTHWDCIYFTKFSKSASPKGE